MPRYMQFGIVFCRRSNLTAAFLGHAITPETLWYETPGTTNRLDS